MRRTTNVPALALILLSGIALLLGPAGCSDRPAPVAPGGIQVPIFADVSVQESSRYVAVFAAERLPAVFREHISKLGGSVDATLDEIGVAVVSGLTETQAAELAAEPDVRHVEPDLVMTLADDHTAEVSGVELSEAHGADPSTQSHGSPTAAMFYSRQWNLRAIAADAAWVAGHLGSSDVTVAILDSGIDYLHPDLEGRVDLARSISLVPSEDARVASLFPERHPITDLHGHGTASAGLVVSNAHHLAAVTQRTTIFGVKVHNGFVGNISVSLEGVLYAADHGADVIQMSFGTTFNKSENPGLVAAVQRAINYAHRKGAVLVTFAGNTPGPLNVPGGPGDYDHDVDRFRLCNAAHVICAAATGPTSAAGLDGPWTNVDLITPYSHFGFSAIDVAAPGGSLPPGVAPALGIWVLCSQTAVTPGPPFFNCGTTTPRALTASSTGTSWSAAITSGFAALLVSTMGKGHPDQVQAAIKNSADDLGEPGFDARYGRGRLNVGRAVGVVP